MRANTRSGVAVAAGVALGLSAHWLRKAAVQGASAATGAWDTALAAEHAAALRVFDLIERTDTQQSAQRKVLLASLKYAIARHAFQEENVIYTMMRDHGLTEAADHLNHDHGYVKQYFFHLGEMPADSPEWLPKVQEFRTMIVEHMREEEDELFPRLRGSLSEAQNRHVTVAMHREGVKLA